MASHPASKDFPAVVASGPAFTTGAYSCSGMPPSGTRPGEVVQLQASLGPYKAVLSGTVKGVGLPYQVTLSKPTVTVSDDGSTSSYNVLGPEPTTLFGLTFARTAWNPNLGYLAHYSESALCIAWLGSPYAPTVISTVYTGGAHCCFLSNFFGASPGVFAGAVNLGNAAAVLAPVGKKEAALITGDNDFAYAFTDFAGSGFPIRVLQVASGGGSVVDVTRSWHHLIALDAQFWLSQFSGSMKRSAPHDERGLLAAWAADECELGRCGSAFAFLGHLKSGDLTFPGNQAPSSYLRELHDFLAAHGYIRS